jgi:lipopolysaccharide export LptBFGC system permease protein LptF
MRWPWTKRDDEERLKQELRRRAQAASGAVLPKEPVVEPPPEQSAQRLHRPPEQHRAAAAASRPAPPHPAGPLPGVTVTYAGTDMTCFIGRKGRAIGFVQRPVPLHVLPVPRPQAFLGYDLTSHRDLRGSRSAFGPLARRAMQPRVSIACRVLGALRWLVVLKPKILIIERYIWGEAFGFFLLGSMGFTFFLIITSVFALGEKIFSKHIPPFTITKVLILLAPAYLVLAIPVAVLFCTLMAMGRLNRDNEIVAMATNGISLYRIFVPFIAIAVVAGLLTWTVYDRVVPPNNRAYKEVLKVFWDAQVVDFIKPATVIKAPERKYFYIDHIDRTEGIMYGLRVYDYYGESGQTRNFPRVYVAERAWIKDQQLVLANVKLFEIASLTGDTLVSASVPEVKIDISTRLSEFSVPPHPTELSASELRLRIKQNADRIAALPFPDQVRIQNQFRDLTEYYLKFAIPFACLALVLVAVPVSLRGPRDERNMGVILSFLLMMAYYITFFVCRTLGSRGLVLGHGMLLAHLRVLPRGFNLLPPLIAGWLPVLLFLAWSVFLIARARK